MRRIAAGPLALAAASALLAAVVPAATGGFSASVRSAPAAETATWFSCRDAFAASASSAVFQWALSETTSTTVAVDSSGQGVNGTYVGSRATTQGDGVGCRRDGAIAPLLNGRSDYIRSATTAPTQSATSFTVEARVQVLGGTGGDILSLCDRSSAACSQRDDRLYLAADGRVVFATYSTRFQVLASPRSIVDGAWHHVAGTLSAAGMRLYVDGVDVTAASTAYQGSTADFRSGANPAEFTSTRTPQAWWRVGGTDGDNWPLWAGTYLSGSVSWAAAYRAALPASVIRAHWAAGR